MKWTLFLFLALLTWGAYEWSSTAIPAIRGEVPVVDVEKTSRNDGTQARGLSLAEPATLERKTPAQTGKRLSAGAKIAARTFGCLRGTVLRRTGKPAVGITLRLEIEDNDVERSEQEPAEGKRRKRKVGRRSAKVVTDASGGFRADGLRQGHWHVSAQFDDQKRNQRRLTSESIPSDGVERRFIYSRAHLLIRAPGLSVPLKREWNKTAANAGWPETPRLVVRRVSLQSEELLITRSLRPRTLEPGSFACDVEMGNDYIVAVFGGETAPVMRRVSVTIDSGAIEVVLPASQPAVLAELTLEPQSNLFMEDFSKLRYTVSDPQTGLELVSQEAFWHLDPLNEPWRREPFVARIAPGTYTVTIEGRHYIDSERGRLISSRRVGSWSQEVVLGAGQSLRVGPTIPPGARVQVSLAGRGTLRDASVAVPEPNAGAQDGAVQFDLTRVAATLTLRTPSGREVPLFFKFERWKYSQKVGFEQRRFAQLNRDSLSEQVTPGRYRVIATLAGGRTVERDITLHAGKTCAVTLRFPDALEFAPDAAESED